MEKLTFFEFLVGVICLTLSIYVNIYIVWDEMLLASLINTSN